jgi:hypothetical protein
VPHPPGLRAFDFEIDWDTVRKCVEEHKLLKYIENKREEYSVLS